jgi:DNA adenine methylase
MEKSISTIYPFLKWAGGKRWLTHLHINVFPNKYNCYFEPFLGSGAVFFYLCPNKAYLADINVDLIEVYNAVKENPKELLSVLNRHNKNHSVEYYYKVRKIIPKNKILRAARFIYLNRTCWNGLYRVNNKGQFNVPIGTKDKVLLDIDDFQAVSSLLKKAKIVASDFAKTMAKAQKDDFIFVDPPYTVKHNHNSFVKYNEVLFSWEDQLRLRNSVISALGRGAKILISNAAHDSIRQLYKDIGKISCFSRASVLASDPLRRGNYEEFVVKCGY